jgi:uncharacterized protein (TIGR00369 family)
MDGLAFVANLVGSTPMPMAEHFGFELSEVKRGSVFARATPLSEHENPLGVVQGGFASSVLDIAIGLASISVLEGDASGVATIELSVRYLRPILESTGPMNVRADVLHSGSTIVVAEARLSDSSGKPYACAQSSSLIIYASRQRTSSSVP